MRDRELTLANLLMDPLTLAMMAADRVDPVELKAAWTALARKLALARPFVYPPSPCIPTPSAGVPHSGDRVRHRAGQSLVAGGDTGVRPIEASGLTRATHEWRGFAGRTHNRDTESERTTVMNRVHSVLAVACPTLDRLLTDPMTQATMAADKLDPAELRADWTALAGRLALTRAAELHPKLAHAGCGARSW